MKKLISLFLVCVILCSCNYDPYEGKRPFDYGDAIWVCESPSVCFEVKTSSPNYHKPEGLVSVNDKEVYYTMEFDPVCNTVFLEIDFNHKLMGECEFSPQKMVVKVDKKTDTLFNGQYDELVFVRQEVTTTE